MPMLDWVFLAVLAASLLLGAWRGLVYEVLSVTSWVAAFIVAQWLAPDAAAAESLRARRDLRGIGKSSAIRCTPALWRWRWDGLWFGRVGLR